MKTQRNSEAVPQTLVCTECGNRMKTYVKPTTTEGGWTNAWCFRTNAHKGSKSRRLEVLISGR